MMTGPVTEREATIVNPLGLHARPAAQLVRLASSFQADIFFSKDGMEVNGKSIMGVMMLAAECGSSIVIRAAGPDADRAVQALAELVAAGFGEM
jgi:phosphocarrier protein HPr